MAPTKATREVRARQPLKLTNNITKNNDQNFGLIKKSGKRKAEMSPTRNDKIKRSALGNVTNAVNNLQQKENQLTGKSNIVAGNGVVGGTGRKRDILTIGKQEQQLPQQQQSLGILSDVSNLKNSKSQTTTTTSVLVTAVNALNNLKKQPQSITTKPFPFQYKQPTTNNEAPIINDLEIPPQVPTLKQPIIGHTKIMTRAAAARANIPPSVYTTTTYGPINLKQKDGQNVIAIPGVEQQQQQKPTRRISNEFHKSKSEEESLYMSALENCSSSESLHLSESIKTRRSLLSSTSNSSNSLLSLSTSTGQSLTKSTTLSVLEEIDYIRGENTKVPANITDFDKENWDDPFQVSNYAMDIFNYLKSREEKFICLPYLDMQKNLTRWMRSLLVDWMVEVQETFELNHETLYLAVKIVDLYLCNVLMEKDDLQLLGAAALFMSCKYDERTPPLIDDFLYICDGAYSQKQIISMEKDVFKTIGYDLGIPLSYRFLRRYARVSITPMPILTLARYVLEFSLMDYDLITISESKMACAALFIALRMSRTSSWTDTLEYFSGYKLTDFASIVKKLNNGLHLKQKDAIKTVRNKYSHKIFFEVAKTPLLTNDELFETEMDLVN